MAHTSFLETVLSLAVAIAVLAGTVLFIGRNLHRFNMMARVAVGLAFFVVVLGAFVRLNDAGLGCPDWPGCYGDLSPAHAAERIAQEERANPYGPVTMAKAWKEMVHRYVAAGLGSLIIGLAIAAWRGRASWGRSPWLPTLIVGVVMLQGAFGAWTVTLGLWPIIVTGHLVGGLLTLSLLWWVALDSASRRAALTRDLTSTLRPLAIACALVVVTQILLGGWVSTNYAALACPDFPTCLGAWVPDTNFGDAFQLSRRLGLTVSGEPLPADALSTIHWAHRAFALAVVGTVAMLGWRARRTPELRGIGNSLLVLLATQVTLGVSNVMLALPLLVAVAHNGGAALLLLGVLAVNHRLTATN
jgi:cytochrome c oxidase assembly protein subunit 15